MDSKKLQLASVANWFVSLLSGFRTALRKVPRKLRFAARKTGLRALRNLRKISRLAGRLHRPRTFQPIDNTPKTGKRWYGLPGSGRRSIVGDTLALQLLSATILGALAISGLWMISQAVIHDSMQKWAQTWITELEELGAPLLNSKDNERFLRIENYIANFEEIALVRYYTPEGAVLFSDSTKAIPAEESPPLLSHERMQALRKTIKTEKQYVLETSADRQSLFIASAPVWVESMNADNLVSLDMKSSEADKVEIIGFVELGLDFSHYQQRLLTGIIIGSMVFTVALALIAMGQRYLLKGALKPLAELELPLSRLAAGDTAFEVGPTRYKEIRAINKALKTTISSLNQRDKMLRRLADYDSLTGLPNRRFFTQELEEEIAFTGRHGKTSALLFVDLDQFKCVNDSLGHAVGDRVLVQVAANLKDNLRKSDLIARFGGDEFTIILRDIDRENTVRIVEDLMNIMQDFQFIEDGNMLNILCSIGVTMIEPCQCQSDELLSQADLACHEAKACGRNCYKFHELSNQEKDRIAADMGWSQRIKDALKYNNLLLYYQPIVDLTDGTASMYEVLLRMRGEDGKIIPPAAFIPAANRFGLMVEIDHFVIRTAMEALAEHRRQGRDIMFTINLSGYVFNDDKLVDFIKEHLDKNRLAPSSLIFEITEQVAVRHLDKARGLIHELMGIGCRFALDDFGAGFSSFNYLKHIPVDFIKIDGGFIKNMANDQVDQAMVESIIQIAKALGKKSIAEFVQDGETLAMLRDLGIDFAQGFHVGKPAATLTGSHTEDKSRAVDWGELRDECKRMCIRWHLRDNASFRRLESMMTERGVPVSHSTIHRWIKRHLERPSLPVKQVPEPFDADYLVEEALVAENGRYMHLYRATSINGTLLDFKLYEESSLPEAIAFFRNQLPGRETFFPAEASLATSS